MWVGVFFWTQCRCKNRKIAKFGLTMYCTHADDMMEMESEERDRLTMLVMVGVGQKRILSEASWGLGIGSESDCLLGQSKRIGKLIWVWISPLSSLRWLPRTLLHMYVSNSIAHGTASACGLWISPSFLLWELKLQSQYSILWRKVRGNQRYTTVTVMFTFILTFQFR